MYTWAVTDSILTLAVTSTILRPRILFMTPTMHELVAMVIGNLSDDIVNIICDYATTCVLDPILVNAMTKGGEVMYKFILSDTLALPKNIIYIITTYVTHPHVSLFKISDITQCQRNHRIDDDSDISHVHDDPITLVITSKKKNARTWSHV